MYAATALLRKCWYLSKPSPRSVVPYRPYAPKLCVSSGRFSRRKPVSPSRNQRLMAMTTMRNTRLSHASIPHARPCRV